MATDSTAYVLHKLIAQAGFASEEEALGLHALVDGDATVATDDAGNLTVKVKAPAKADAKA